MSPALFLLLTFVAGVLAVIGLYSILTDIFLRDRERVSQRVDHEFRQRMRDQAKAKALFKTNNLLIGDVVDVGEAGPTVRQWFDALIEQSGTSLTLGRLMMMMAIFGVGAGLLASLLTFNVIFGFAVAIIGGVAPLFYVMRKRTIRLEKMMAQLPDAFDLMARVIRAGQTVSQALLAVSDEFRAPIAPEFAYCYEQQNLGLSPEIAMRDLAKRTGLLEIKIFVLALLVQQQTGGNLAELLDKLAAVIRERFRIRSKIRTLTAEGRIQALVLLALPPVLLVVILLLNKQYAAILLSYPGLLLGTFAAEVVGALWIRKIVNFDY